MRLNRKPRKPVKGSVAVPHRPHHPLRGPNHRPRPPKNRLQPRRPSHRQRRPVTGLVLRSGSGFRVARTSSSGLQAHHPLQDHLVVAGPLLDALVQQVRQVHLEQSPRVNSRTFSKKTALKLMWALLEIRETKNNSCCQLPKTCKTKIPKRN